MPPAPRFWNARWIHPSADPSGEVGLFAFRLRFEGKAASRVRVSADQRYRLYLNGTQVEFGPARSEPWTWNFEEVDLGPWLEEGENTLLALVWSFGSMAPMAQMTCRTGFILEGEGVSTPAGWECARVPGFAFGSYTDNMDPTYFVVGPGERIDGEVLPSWWSLAGNDSLGWEQAKSFWPGTPGMADIKGPIIGWPGKEEGTGVGESPWLLTPRAIPSMLYEDTGLRPQRVDWATGIRSAFGSLTLTDGEEVLLDFEELLTAFPRIRASGGGVLEVSYAEALIGEDWKGNRNEVVGKRFRGASDFFVTGQNESVFEPLWWRCFRYVLLRAKGPVQVESFVPVVTGYPLLDEARWESSGHRHGEIYQAALRTCRLCAGETYFDCPYYEQLQYLGDTRIQAQIGRYLSRDRRLQKQAVDAFARSVARCGLTQSRYPSREPQIIPGFSLWWIHMLADQHLYDPEGVNPDHLGLAQGVLDWFVWAIQEAPERAYWAFVDWVPAWEAGVPPGGLRSVCHTLHLVWTQAVFARLTGDDELRDEVRESLWSFPEHEGRVVDLTWDPEAEASEHSLALRRLLFLELGLEVPEWPSVLPEGCHRTTYFYSWYRHQAQAELDYEVLLAEWRDQLDRGLTTFAENPEPTRSDCHAWSSHPILGFFQRVAGVTSDGPGWSRALIRPNPGSLDRFSALIPHPAGDLTVSLEDGEISVSSPVPYRLEWRGRMVES